MSRMLYLPFSAFDASRVGVAPAAGAAALANRLAPSDAARTPAPMVFRASLRPMLISDSFGIAIVDLHPLCALQPELTSDTAKDSIAAAESLRNSRPDALLCVVPFMKFSSTTNDAIQAVPLGVLGVRGRCSKD